jgi:hypothetical protein
MNHNLRNDLGVWGEKNMSRIKRIRLTRVGHVVKQSQYKGVYWDNIAGAWEAVFYEHRGKKSIKHELGFYTEEEDAARAYDAEVIRRFGDRAITNFSLTQERGNVDGKV